MIVQKQVIDNRIEANEVIQAFQSDAFPGMPVVLMAQDYMGTPIYYGREDISKFMANVPLESVPWEEFTLSHEHNIDFDLDLDF